MLAGGPVLPQTHQYSLQSSVRQKTCLVPLAHGISPDKLCGLFQIALMGGRFLLWGCWPGSALSVGEAAAAQLITRLLCKRACVCFGSEGHWTVCFPFVVRQFNLLLIIKSGTYLALKPQVIEKAWWHAVLFRGWLWKKQRVE